MCPNNLRVEFQAVISLELTHARARTRARRTSPEMSPWPFQWVGVAIQWRHAAVAAREGEARWERLKIMKLPKGWRFWSCRKAVPIESKLNFILWVTRKAQRRLGNELGNCMVDDAKTFASVVEWDSFSWAHSMNELVMPDVYVEIGFSWEARRRVGMRFFFLTLWWLVKIQILNCVSALGI